MGGGAHVIWWWTVRSHTSTSTRAAHKPALTQYSLLRNHSCPHQDPQKHDLRPSHPGVKPGVLSGSQEAEARNHSITLHKIHFYFHSVLSRYSFKIWWVQGLIMCNWFAKPPLSDLQNATLTCCCSQAHHLTSC